MKKKDLASNRPVNPDGTNSNIGDLKPPSCYGIRATDGHFGNTLLLASPKLKVYK